jgi:hypothetical protein
MAYAVPKRWAQGDEPLAADINKYKDGLDAIHALMGDHPYNSAVMRGNQPFVMIVHKYRWLIFDSNGTLEDPAGIGETVNITANGWTTYDLSGVDWLFPGKLYKVDDCQFAWEDYEPL